jgi:hypothetical protein
MGRRDILSTVACVAAFHGVAFHGVSASAATVTPYGGDVFVSQGAGFQKVKSGTDVNTGDLVMVGPDGVAQVQLDDGNIITAAPGQVLSVPAKARPTDGALPAGAHVTEGKSGEWTVGDVLAVGGTIAVGATAWAVAEHRSSSWFPPDPVSNSTGGTGSPASGGAPAATNSGGTSDPPSVQSPPGGSTSSSSSNPSGGSTSSSSSGSGGGTSSGASNPNGWSSSGASGSGGWRSSGGSDPGGWRSSSGSDPGGWRSSGDPGSDPRHADRSFDRDRHADREDRDHDHDRDRDRDHDHHHHHHEFHHEHPHSP